MDITTEHLNLPGAAHHVFPVGVTHLQPREAAFASMLDGWTKQQRSRNLRTDTIRQRIRTIERFHEFSDQFPWEWGPADFEDWGTSLLSTGQGLSPSTLRTYQGAVSMFLEYLIDPRYGWIPRTQELFGRAPNQICHEWNTLAHRSEYEGDPRNRAMTKSELAEFFKFADDQVERARSSRRKGWISAFRDATIFKVIYAYGLRRREAAMLDLRDFSRNSEAPEFGDYGMLRVRWAKAHRGGPPRRRNTLTVFPWTVEVLREYIEEIRPMYPDHHLPALWLTERGGRVSGHLIGARFRQYRRELGFEDRLGPHCLRHSYVTHLFERGLDQMFVQQQVGHRYASTTALYTSVASDYKNMVLRKALDEAFPEDDG